MDELPEIVELLGMFATLGPAIAAFILVGRESGRAGMGGLLRRAFAIGFDKRWWLPTLLLLPLIGLLSVFILSLLGEVDEAWTAPSIVTVLGTAAYILVVGGGLEEFGWRGYALDRMQNGKNAIIASLVLGFMWGLWHLPLFFKEGTVQEAIPAWQFFLQQMVLAVLYTWLYNNTGGSLLASILFHTFGNTSSALLPAYFATELGRWTNFSLLLVTLVMIGVVWGWRTLNHNRPVPQTPLPA
jgi:membrane protease YdiL (CAAX protease family)